MTQAPLNERWIALKVFVDNHAYELGIAQQMGITEFEAFRSAFGAARQRQDEASIHAAEAAMNALQEAWG